MTTQTLRFLGIDLGSTTVKYALIDSSGSLLARNYVRHQSAVVATLLAELQALKAQLTSASPDCDPNSILLKVNFTGSAALELSQAVHANFVQEVIAASTFLKSAPTPVDVAIELGGEDGKIIFLTNGVELRMNEACAGGTGAFADQMATLLNVSTSELNTLASQATKIHPIASRCGVFAKTDVVALLNQGVPKSEIAKSVFAAICEQTIAGLACGRPIEGNVCFLGGPLSFLSELKQSFIHKLQSDKVQFLNLEHTQYAIALGAAKALLTDSSAAAQHSFTLDSLIAALQNCQLSTKAVSLAPLFLDLADSAGTSASASASDPADTPVLLIDERQDTVIGAGAGADTGAGTGTTAKTKAQDALENETYEQFKLRHAQACVETKPLAQAVGPLFLGIDLGSTTIKLVLLNQHQEMLESFYAPNGGAPLKFLLPKVQELLAKIPAGAYLAAICTTGYGADLAKAALNAQFTEVETLAHQRAAVAFDPQVSYVIDIGGQDMKCIEVSSGLITSIQLNEACSSGCGSFLETFASQLNLPLSEFVQQALHAAAPCDLGTRCTVFMNSKVKQAQRDNTPVGDIAAGLCLSIVRNALYKVLRIHDSSELGEHVVVQGGTFLNDAILRAFELNIGRHVTRPNIAGLMGAYGAALLAQERCQTPEQAMRFTSEQFDLSKIKTRDFRCRGCNNHCALTMNTFLSGQKHMQGNRCDFALHHADKSKEQANSANFCDFKNQLLFERPVLMTPELAQAEAQAEAQAKAKAQAQSTAASADASAAAATAKAARAAALLQQAKAAKAQRSAAAAASPAKQASPAGTASATAKVTTTYIPADQGLATRGSIGIPRVLNMFEHYPFWHALFTELKFHVCLSPQSDAAILALGNQSIPSQSLCLPAKLSHGHITYLAQHGMQRVFLPCVPRETKQDYFSENDEHFACPVVGGYPEALRLNLQSTFPELKLYTPFLMLNTPQLIVQAIQEIDPKIGRKEILAAIKVAQAAQDKFHLQLEEQAVAQLERAEREHLPLMVIAGHPYHIDPFINHGIPGLLASMGTCLVTEDAIAHLTMAQPELEVVNQWAFHSRLYRAAQFVLEHPRSELVQLVSFGCGIDAITSEQVKKLLQRSQRLYTMLKIDEGDTLGAAKIRLRSLLCATQALTAPALQASATAAASTQAAATTAATPAAHGAAQNPDLFEHHGIIDGHGQIGDIAHGEYEHLGAIAYQRSQESTLTTQGLIAGDYITIEGTKQCCSCGCGDESQLKTMPLSQALANQSLEGRTIYMPQMAPVHFPILAACLNSLGYKVKLLEDVSEEDIEQGLKLINNDACYPAIVAIGQLLTPLVKEKIDPQTSALLLAQTCGSCRATNYTALLEWALHDLKSEIPIVTLQGSTLHDSHLHLKLGVKGLKRLLTGLLYGDLLQHLYLHTKTYEVEPGAAHALLQYYHHIFNADFLGSKHSFKRTCQKMIQDFAQIPLRSEQRPKVGIVGEILLKYHPVANNHIVEHVIAEGGEPVLGDITAFVLYCLHGNVYQAQTFGIDKLKGVVTWFVMKHFEHMRHILVKLLNGSPFGHLPSFNALLQYGQRFTTWGQQAGEGWLLEAEMLDFIEHDIPNVLCVQPFACLPNHITGKGLMRTIRENYPQANLCSLDFEAGTTQSNVVNRLKLFMSQAQENLQAQQAQQAQQTKQAKQHKTVLEESAHQNVPPAISSDGFEGFSAAYVTAQASNVAAQVTAQASNMAAHVTAQASNVAAQASNVAAHAADTVVDVATDMAANVAAHAKAATASAKEAAQSASTTVVNAASYAADAAKNVSSTVRHAANNAASVAAQATNAAAHAADLMADATSHVVEVATYAQDAVADVAAQAVQVGKKVGTKANQ